MLARWDPGEDLPGMFACLPRVLWGAARPGAGGLGGKARVGKRGHRRMECEVG